MILCIIYFHCTKNNKKPFLTVFNYLIKYIFNQKYFKKINKQEFLTNTEKFLNKLIIIIKNIIYKLKNLPIIRYFIKSTSIPCTYCYSL